MAYTNPNEAGGPPPYVRFDGGDTYTAYRALRWDHAGGTGVGKPVAPSGQDYSAICDSSGKGAFLAVPGAVVQLEANVAAGQTITAGNLYAINTNGQLTQTAGVMFKALETVNNSGGGSSMVDVIWAEVWKPKG